MIRIAVCDDEENELKHLYAIVQQIIKIYPEIQTSITTFQSAHCLLDAIRDSKNFDIYLMDTIMPEINGIELGQIIRKKDEQAVIIYLSSTPEYAVLSYSVQAYYYLLKPVNFEELNQVLQRVFKRYGQINTCVGVKTSNGMVTVSKKTIVYVEYHDHYLSYYLENGGVINSVSFRESFSQKTFGLLQDFHFTKVSASVIVNMSYVNKISRKGFTLMDKKELRITRTYQSARKYYLEFLISNNAGS